MYTYRITVFTPTYNRAHILPQLFTSLREQSFKDFEWLIVDDGSTDQTESLVASWISQNTAFPIRYYKTENGGKHRAINHGVALADGELFFTVDSDDYLTTDALEKIDRWFLSIQDQPQLCGITANKGTSITETPNPLFSAPYLDKTFLDMNTYTENGSHVLSGERAVIFYTDYHKKHLFPEISGERFLTEAVLYNRMAHDGCKVRFYNDIIWIYEYKEDGLTKAGNRLFLNNPHGYGLWLKEKALFENASKKELLKLYYTFTCDLSSRLSCQEIADCIGTSPTLISLLKLAHQFKHLIRK